MSARRGQLHLTAHECSLRSALRPARPQISSCAWVAPDQAIDSLGHCVAVRLHRITSRWLGPALDAFQAAPLVPGTGSGTWRLRRQVIYRTGVLRHWPLLGFCGLELMGCVLGPREAPFGSQFDLLGMYGTHWTAEYRFRTSDCRSWGPAGLRGPCGRSQGLRLSV
jgi:hypothetical protein